MAYWPPTKSSTATATCWLALSDSTLDNGCMRFVAGSHLEPQLRPHAPGAMPPQRHGTSCMQQSSACPACTVCASTEMHKMTFEAWGGVAHDAQPPALVPARSLQVAAICTDSRNHQHTMALFSRLLDIYQNSSHVCRLLFTEEQSLLQIEQ